MIESYIRIGRGKEKVIQSKTQKRSDIGRQTGRETNRKRLGKREEERKM